MANKILLFLLTTFFAVNTGDFQEENKQSPEYIINGDTAVKLIVHHGNESATLKIYSNVNDHMTLVQEFDSLLWSFLGSDAEFIDCNGDKLVDLRLPFAYGANLGNSYSYVFLGDSLNDNFYFLKGSDEIPNISYDTTRNVIEGVFFAGSASFIDFRIDGDTLKAIEGVEVEGYDDKTVRNYLEYDDSGEYKVTRRDTIFDNGESGFSREKQKSPIQN